MTAPVHVILGTGPVGCWIARVLCEQQARVRAVNRTGARPGLMPAAVEMVAADLSDPAQARTAATGASVVYQALNPPYHRWHELFPALQAAALGAARSAQAKYVSVENLYMYDSSRPITEDSLVAPRSRKGELRRQMADEVLAAHARGEVRAVALRSSDYYGPGVTGSALGERFFGSLVAGKKAQVMGSAVPPHSLAYIEDVGRAAVAVASDDAALGRAWIAPHAPALSQGEIVAEACRVLGTEPRFAVVSPLMLRLVGLFIPEARASVEMMYQFTAPFVVDSRQIERAYSLTAHPLASGIERTVAWYQAQRKTA